MLGLAICIAVALDLAARRLRRWLPVTALVASLMFLTVSVYRVLSVEMSSVSPDRSRRLKDALHFVVGWAPFPAAVTVTMLALTAGLAVATLVVMALGATRGAPDGVTAPAPDREEIRSEPC